MNNQDKEPTIKVGDNEYIELFLKHLVNCPEVMAKAKRFNFIGDDLMIDGRFGNFVYKVFVDAAMSIGEAPINAEIFAAHIGNSEEVDSSGDLDGHNIERLFTFLFCTETTLTPNYFLSTLKEFIRTRRWNKCQSAHPKDPDAFLAQWRTVDLGLAVDDFQAQVVDVRPFAAPLIKTQQNRLGTGITPLEDVGCGLNLGEYGLIIGYTAGGKTALGANITLNNALAGRKAQFISIEEDEVEISQRYYSNIFEISYSELHNGRANIQLEEMFRNPPTPGLIPILNENLCLTGMKGVQGPTPSLIYQTMLRNYENSGFIPEVVVLDQMQFLTPEGYNKKMDAWEKEKLLSAELDELSHKTIAGRHFCLWVLHQAKGNRKRRFKEEDIDGFKGISHPADLVIGIGRDHQNPNECTVFTLKNRHGAEFDVDVQTELQYMRFPDTRIDPVSEPPMNNLDRN